MDQNRWSPWARTCSSFIYPESGLTDGDMIIAHCAGINSIELLRFFDKVMVRLDPCDSEEEFGRVYFMAPRQIGYPPVLQWRRFFISSGATG
jgi:hypothetical protein